MQFWLRQDNEFFWLPVPPEDFSIDKGLNNSTVVVEELGELSLIGSPKLSSITISSIFPMQCYYFCQYKNIKAPYDCVKLIEKWIHSKRPIGLLITGTNINMTCTIESFTYGEKDGTRDVYFTIQLKEYKKLDIKYSITESAPTFKRAVTKPSPPTYTVKGGDYLILIAKKCLGDGNRWREIYNNNKSVIGSNPNLIYPGQVYTL